MSIIELRKKELSNVSGGFDLGGFAVGAGLAVGTSMLLNTQRGTNVRNGFVTAGTFVLGGANWLISKIPGMAQKADEVEVEAESPASGHICWRGWYPGWTTKESYFQ